MQNLKAKLPAIRVDINKALAEVAARHGLTSLVAGSCTFDPTAGCFTFKLEGVEAGGVDKSGAIYKASEQLLNLPPLGSEFTGANGRRHTTIGLNHTGTKVITKADDGKQYLVPVDAVVRITRGGGSART